MVSGDVDPAFPACCSRCPHLETVTAACTHRHRQTTLNALDEERVCPVFAAEKSAAMRRLAESLR